MASQPSVLDPTSASGLDGDVLVPSPLFAGAALVSEHPIEPTNPIANSHTRPCWALDGPGLFMPAPGAAPRKNRANIRSPRFSPGTRLYHDRIGHLGRGPHDRTGQGMTRSVMPFPGFAAAVDPSRVNRRTSPE